MSSGDLRVQPDPVPPAGQRPARPTPAPGFLIAGRPAGNNGKALPVVGDLRRPDAGQFTKISNLFTGMRQCRTLGLVWFDKVRRDGIYHQDWRIENDPQATAAFRLVLSELASVRP